MDIKKIRGEYLLIEPVEKESITTSGIKLAKQPEQGDFSIGIIKKVGTGKVIIASNKEIPSAHFQELDLKVGDKVLFRYGIKIDGTLDWLLVNEADVVVVIE